MNRRSVFLRTLLATWWIPVLFAAAAVAFQVWRITSRPTEYVTVGKIIVGIKVLDPKWNADLGSQVWHEFFATQIEILESGELKHRALDRVRSLHPELKEIDVEIRVARTKGSWILDVAAVGEEPKYTRVYLDAMLDEYIAFRRDLVEQNINGALNKVISEVLNRDKELKKKKDTLDYFLKTRDAPLLAAEHERLAKRVSSLRGELDNLKSSTADSAKIQDKQKELTEAEKKLSEINEQEATRKRLQDDFDHADKDLKDWKRNLYTPEPSTPPDSVAIMERPIPAVEETPDLLVPLFVSVFLGAFAGVIIMLVIASIAALTAAAPESSGPPPLQ